MDLKKRIVGIITDPRGEWSIIAAERVDARSLYLNYIAILAAIPAVAVFVGLTPLSSMAALAIAITSYLVSLVTPILVALIVERIAPRFQSSGDTTEALKLVAYAYTPIWLAGIFYLVIALSRLQIIGVIYAGYLLYVGLPVVMKTPDDKVVPFTLVTTLIVLVVNLILSALLGNRYYGF